jgi:hypothetical protein
MFSVQEIALGSGDKELRESGMVGTFQEKLT